MQDPFIRQLESKHIFDHISESEITKFIVGCSYLEKDKLDMLYNVGINPKISENVIFINEMKVIYGQPIVK